MLPECFCTLQCNNYKPGYLDFLPLDEHDAIGLASRGRPLSKTIQDLFDRWEQVWHEGRYDLVETCVADSYLRHDEKGDRVVTPVSYRAEIMDFRTKAPDIRFIVHDSCIDGDRVWFRNTLKWSDTQTGQAASRASMQVYRIEGGKLAETWVTFLPPGSAWNDTPRHGGRLAGSLPRSS
jgi:hypothetical protein